MKKFRVNSVPNFLMHHNTKFCRVGPDAPPTVGPDAPRGASDPTISLCRIWTIYEFDLVCGSSDNLIMCRKLSKYHFNASKLIKFFRRGGVWPHVFLGVNVQLYESKILMQTFQSVHLSSDIFFFLIHPPLSEYAYRWSEMSPGGRLALPMGASGPTHGARCPPQ